MNRRSFLSSVLIACTAPLVIASKSADRFKWKIPPGGNVWRPQDYMGEWSIEEWDWPFGADELLIAKQVGTDVDGCVWVKSGSIIPEGWQIIGSKSSIDPMFKDIDVEPVTDVNSARYFALDEMSRHCTVDHIKACQSGEIPIADIINRQ